MTDKIDLSKRIGERLRGLRKSMGLSIRRLSDGTGFSPSLFSRIEKGSVIPSILTLKTISDYLRIDISYFFEGGAEKEFVISKPGKRRIVKLKKGSKKKAVYEAELLAEGMENIFMEPTIVTLLGKDHEVELTTHAGQEFSYILEGKMEMTLGTNKFTMKKGDAAYYNANIPHKATSLGEKPAKVLSVHLIPGRRAGTFETNS